MSFKTPDELDVFFQGVIKDYKSHEERREQSIEKISRSFTSLGERLSKFKNKDIKTIQSHDLAATFAASQSTIYKGMKSVDGFGIWKFIIYTL